MKANALLSCFIFLPQAIHLVKDPQKRLYEKAQNFRISVKLSDEHQSLSKFSALMATFMVKEAVGQISYYMPLG